MENLAEKIKPKVKGKSDKYSWNLYKWVKKKGFYPKVWFDTENRLNGEKLEFDKENFPTYQLWIGGSDKEGLWFYGSSLRSILSPRCKEWANPWMANKHIDITDWFWNEYIKIGRCIWDKSHDGWLENADERFAYVGNTRKCKWCGKWQAKEIIKETTISRYDVWK